MSGEICPEEMPGSRKPIYDFLLVNNTNLHRLYCFRDTAGYWSNVNLLLPVAYQAAAKNLRRGEMRQPSISKQKHTDFANCRPTVAYIS